MDPIGKVLCDISAHSQTRECFDKPNCPGIVTVAVIDYVERFVLRSAVSTGLKKRCYLCLQTLPHLINQDTPRAS